MIISPLFDIYKNAIIFKGHIHVNLSLSFIFPYLDPLLFYIYIYCNCFHSLNDEDSFNSLFIK